MRFFGVAFETDLKAEKKVRALNAYCSILERSLEPIYGDGVRYISVGFICTRLPAGYEDWHKARKPRYRKVEKVKLLDGTESTFENTFSYDVKLDPSEFDEFVALSDGDAIKMFASKLENSLSNLEALPAKAKPFDSNRFRVDFTRLSRQALLDLGLA